MPSKQSAVPDLHLRTLMTGLMFGESPRWGHDDRLWLADWGAQEVVAVDLEGTSEVMVQLRFPSFQPICIDWLPDGRLLIVSASDRLLLRRETDGSLVTHADLTGLSHLGFNEIVVDGRGNAYVNGGGFNLMAGEKFAPGIVALVTPDGSARQVADGIAFPNGMAVTPDNSTLISVTASPTASAWTRKARSGTRTSRTSAACASAKAATCCRRSPWTLAVSPACSEAWTGERCSWWSGSGVVFRARPTGHERARYEPCEHPHRAPAGLEKASSPTNRASRCLRRSRLTH